MKRKSGFRGFTLIEVMVVLLIVTVLAGVTMTRLPGFAQNADFEEEKRRLQVLFEMARQESILDSSEFGFRLTNDGYKFLKFDDGSQSWVDVIGSFRERSLPDDFTLKIKTNRQGENLFGKKSPPIAILSSGENTPFQLILSSGFHEHSIALISEGYGQFYWEEL